MSDRYNIVFEYRPKIDGIKSEEVVAIAKELNLDNYRDIWSDDSYKWRELDARMLSKTKLNKFIKTIEDRFGADETWYRVYEGSSYRGDKYNKGGKVMEEKINSIISKKLKKDLETGRIFETYDREPQVLLGSFIGTHTLSIKSEKDKRRALNYAYKTEEDRDSDYDLLYKIFGEHYGKPYSTGTGVGGFPVNDEYFEFGKEKFEFPFGEDDLSEYIPIGEGSDELITEDISEGVDIPIIPQPAPPLPFDSPRTYGLTNIEVYDNGEIIESTEDGDGNNVLVIEYKGNDYYVKVSEDMASVLDPNGRASTYLYAQGGVVKKNDFTMLGLGVLGGLLIGFLKK